MFSISDGVDTEFAESYDEAYEIALDWSVEEHGTIVKVTDEETGKVTEVWA